MKKSTSSPHQKCCPLCDSPDIEVFIQIPEVPVHCNLLWRTSAQALAAPRGDISLAYCRSCAHIFNTVFNPELMNYDHAYENSLHFSPRFHSYARSLAEDIIERFSLRGKTVIEIGCGKGDFLNLLVEGGVGRAIGFDPSYEDARNDYDDERITFVKDFYSEQHSNQKVDFVVSRHVLEHIQFPRPFLHNIHRTLGRGSTAVVFFEVPNVLYTLRDLGVWDLIYEHCSYFTEASLATLFDLCGFEVIKCRTAFENQFLCIEAASAQGETALNSRAIPSQSEYSDYVSTFGRQYNKKLQFWRLQLTAMQKGKKRVVLWGAGSKGTTFLNVVGAQNAIRYVIDINPHKEGMFVAGSGQSIMPPSFVKEYRPDMVVVMNPIYVDEIRRHLSQMAVHPDILTA
jgi:2-polyprenyl-3-methyl-5-hydroxy-6-metoxy-1,4-benzoquinol methylase